MNVIVTGGDGFVGSAVVNRILKDKNNKVLVFDLPPKPNRLDLLNKRLTYFSCTIENIKSKENIIKKFKPKVLYHFAWKGSAGPLREDYNVQINNAINTLKLYLYACKLNIDKFIMAGTISEYEAMNSFYNDLEASPKSFYYGMGKQIAHELCKPFSVQSKTKLIWTYITNVYGPGENSPRLINSVIKNIIAKKNFSFNSSCEQYYDFIFIDDIANAFYLIAKCRSKHFSYVLGTGNPKKLNKIILELYKSIPNVKSYPLFNSKIHSNGLPIKIFSNRNLFNDTKFKIKTNFNEGIIKTYKWLIKQNKS